MTEKDTRRLYKPPRARALSASSVSGQEPLGICSDGSALTFGECAYGDSPAGGACSPSGLLPTLGYCSEGNNAVEGCTSGGIHL